MVFLKGQRNYRKPKVRCPSLKRAHFGRNIMLLREDAESMEGWAYGKHRQIGGNDEDGPPSKVLESRGIRTLWVILVVHKIGRFGWI